MQFFREFVLLSVVAAIAGCNSCNISSGLTQEVAPAILQLDPRNSWTTCNGYLLTINAIDNYFFEPRRLDSTAMLWLPAGERTIYYACKPMFRAKDNTCATEFAAITKPVKVELEKGKKYLAYCKDESLKVEESN